MHIIIEASKDISLDPTSYGLSSDLKLTSIEALNASISNTAKINVKSNTITLVDSGGNEYVVTADIKGLVTPTEFRTAWNDAFLAYPDPFVKDMVVTVAKYTNYFVRTTAKQLAGYENIDTDISSTADYNGPTYFFVYKYRSTSHTWLKNDATTIDSACPFISNTLRQSYLDSTNTKGGVGVIWSASLRSTKRYFPIEGTKWLNSTLSLDNKLCASLTTTKYNKETEEYAMAKIDSNIQFDTKHLTKNDTITVNWQPIGYNRPEYNLMDYNSPGHSLSVKLNFD